MSPHHGATAEPGPLLLVGCGNMGRALLRGWALDWPGRLLVIDPLGVTESFGVGREVEIFADLAELPTDLRPAAVLLAVKPQVLPAVLPQYAGLAAEALVISIAAGTSIASLAQGLGLDPARARIVRVMPNTPAAIGQGIAAGYAAPAVTEADRALVARLMAPAGRYGWVESEAQIDFVTAVSGSGPAYVFLLAEAMAAAGEALGLDPAHAAELARETVIGAGVLMRANPERTPAELRQAVTSPGGTTQAALNVLMAPDGMPALLERAVRAAAHRAGELARG